MLSKSRKSWINTYLLLFLVSMFNSGLLTCDNWPCLVVLGKLRKEHVSDFLVRLIFLLAGWFRPLKRAWLIDGRLLFFWVVVSALQLVTKLLHGNRMRWTANLQFLNENFKAVSRYLIRSCVAIHLDTDEEKFHCLSMMSQKLISLALGEILAETPDNPQFQEATVSGHIFLLILRERLESVLGTIKRKIEKVEQRRGDKFILDA